MSEAIWTLDELAERVGAALSVGYDGQPSGRVRHLPDQRAIRWYTTIGLVDRPAATRGRTAMYGPRHLLQLVAIKRLQAQGLSLVAIQVELAGATDAQLARVAQVPEATGSAPPAPPGRPTAALRVAPAVASPSAEGKGPAAPTPALGVGRGVTRRAGFWRERPADAADTAARPVAAAEVAGPAAGAVTLQGVRLGERATLLLDTTRPLDDADLRAILDAAGPLREALRARGLDHPGREHP
jgi:MerR HTH family regulatory protein